MTFLPNPINSRSKLYDLAAIIVIIYNYILATPILEIASNTCSLFYYAVLYGIIKCSLKFLKLIQYILLTISGFILPKCNNLKKKYGEYAFITGATDGIGKAYAKNFAGKDMNLILVGRNQEKLRKTQNEIWEKINNKINIELLEIDFSDKTDAIYNKIENFLKQRSKPFDIGVLVNNVGIGMPQLSKLHELSKFLGEKEAHDTVNDLINVNARSMVKVTPLILKYGGMIAKNKGLIINISSISARLPVAYGILYGAVKQFNQYISDGLRYELGHGKNETDKIEVQTILPSFINTKLVDALG